jgi:SNARE associated Golgi protein
LVGDFVVYFLGYFYGEKVLSFRLTRKFITKQREAQIKGYFHRHGIKILILGRFAVGFRTAAYLTAGILRLPALKLFLTDLCAASLSTLLMFGLGYWFAKWIETGLETIKQYLVLIAAIAVGIGLLYRYVKARRREGKVIGPPVLADSSELPLPPDDLHADHSTDTAEAARAIDPPAESRSMIAESVRDTSAIETQTAEFATINGREKPDDERLDEAIESIPSSSTDPVQNLENSG